MPAPGIPYDWSIVTVYFNTYVNHLASRAQSLRNMSSMCETLPDHNFWRFDIWHFNTRNGFFTSSPFLSIRRFSFIRWFTARSLFGASSLTYILAQINFPTTDWDNGGGEYGHLKVENDIVDNGWIDQRQSYDSDDGAYRSTSDGAANRLPKVALSPFRACSRSHLTLPCLWYICQLTPFCIMKRICVW